MTVTGVFAPAQVKRLVVAVPVSVTPLGRVSLTTMPVALAAPRLFTVST